MSVVVEFEKQISIVERVFYSLFCKLVENNYCGYPISIDKIIKKIDDIREEFSNLEMRYIYHVFATEENFINFLIEETHFKNEGFYNEEENKIFLLLSKEEIEKNKEENADVEMLVNNLYNILQIEKVKNKRLTIAS